MTVLAVRAQDLVGSTIEISQCEDDGWIFEKDREPLAWGPGTLLIILPADLQNLVVSFIYIGELGLVQRTCRAFRRRFVVVKKLKLPRRSVWLILKLAVTLPGGQGAIDYSIKTQKSGRFYLDRTRILGGALVSARLIASPTKRLFSFLERSPGRLLDLGLRINDTLGCERLLEKNPQLTALAITGEAAGLVRHTPMFALRRLTLTTARLKIRVVAESMPLLEILEIETKKSDTMCLPAFGILKDLAHLRRIKYIEIGHSNIHKQTKPTIIAKWCQQIASLPALQEFVTNVFGCDAGLFANRPWKRLRLVHPRNPSRLHLMSVKNCSFVSPMTGDQNGIYLPRNVVRATIQCSQSPGHSLQNLLDAEKLRCLEQLTLSCCVGVRFRGVFANLLKLKLDSVTFASGALRRLQAPRLRSLFLEDISIGTLDDIAHLRALRIIQIRSCPSLSNADAAADLPHLERLAIVGNEFALTNTLLKIPNLRIVIPPHVRLMYV
jgi:hypothetical protein